jgi:mRNA interferase MazF
VKRGDIVIAAAPGDYGKPRPALVVQDDAFAIASITILPFTSALHDAPLLRVTVLPNAENSLRKPCQLMIDKILTLPRARIGETIGRIDDATMKTVNRTLAAFLGLPGAAVSD